MVLQQTDKQSTEIGPTPFEEVSRHSLSKWAVFSALNGGYLNIVTGTVTL